jgi:S-adenosylmethionine synthetase
MTSYLFTSESVTEGHPDKICDQISDAILDACMADDPACRVACETLVKTGMAIIAGEITTTTWVDMPHVVRETIREIGYDSSDMGFDWRTCAVITVIEKQSGDISIGVTEGEGLHSEQGAGDQGLMFGYACTETEELMPLPIMLAHGITRRLTEVRKQGKIPFLRPDGKSQVTVEYEDDQPRSVDTVVVSTQHTPDVEHATIQEAMIEEVIKPVVPAKLVGKDITYYVNPTGRFVDGGPYADSGLTGRKIIVDTYGGYGAHGGGCFSGKDPSKVDRSASYFARYIAKNLVAAGVADRLEIQLAYAIGVARPVSVLIRTFGTGKIEDERISAYVRETFDMRPHAIIDQLDLLRPIYRPTAAYGHFGRSEETFTWERTDRADRIRSDLGIE